MAMTVFDRKLRFHAFHHAYVCTFVEALQEGGTKDLLTLSNQQWRRSSAGETNNDVSSAPPTSFFEHRYSPGNIVAKTHPPCNVDFDPSGAYATYNWELFFHIPLLIATRLMQDERHEEAMRWFHTIFNPTTDLTGPVPKRYWFCKPLRDLGEPESIGKMLQTLWDSSATPAERDDVEMAIAEWRRDGPEPHRIARGRLGAQQKTVVMKYFDNLIAWGDKLFRRDTIESINEAAHLYVLAAKLLGPRSHRVPELTRRTPRTYAELRSKLDAFSNTLVKLENIAQPFTLPASTGGNNGLELQLGLDTFYFCIPPNEDLLRYWETVADRLFKIRHCMNIEGVVRELPLFEPPIDPALLVRARAMGLDLASILDDLSAAAPHYRFSFMLQKAREFCDELRQLGGLLLAALEKRDAEALGRLRATHETSLLQAMREVRRQQVREAGEAIAALEQGKALAALRAQHYEAVSQRLPGEQEFIDRQTDALVFQMASQMAALQGSAATAAVPDVTVSAAGQSSGTHKKVGDPRKVAMIANLVSTYLGWLGQIASVEGAVASYKAGLVRAQQDRDLQVRLAARETRQYEKQIAGAEIRREIAERELANQELQREQAEQIAGFLRDKFTNESLYGWMSSQVSAVYFQAYRLAYDMAKRAERAYRMELGLDESNFVQFGAWDSLRKGLLAGERLSLDLRRLEAAYLDRNRRTYELTKHISIGQLDPVALLELRATGTCEVVVPEVLFDLDYPSHYMRRIRSASMTIPAVTGPYTTVSCTLTLRKHHLRRSATIDSSDTPLDESFGLLQSIATSGGRNDAGLFELSFRDERRLPFEGAGAISAWRIELPAGVRQFDYETISDVILHISYTALEGGAAFGARRAEKLKKALNELAAALGPGFVRAFSLRHEFPDEWHRLRQGHTVSLPIGRERLPYFVGVLEPAPDRGTWQARSEVQPAPLTVDGATIEFAGKDVRTGLWSTATADLGGSESVEVTVEGAKEMDDLVLIVNYFITTA